MRDTKVYLVLKNLNNRERGKFLKYIQSPYFNKNQPLVELFKILNKDLTTKSSKKLDKPGIWRKLQSGQPYDDVRFRKYLSDLLKLLENFLAQQVYEKNELQKTNFLLEAIVDRKMEKLYSSIKKTTNSITEKSKFKNSDFYLFNYQSRKLLHDIETDNEQRKKISTDFNQLSRDLDSYYLAEKFRLSYDAAIWKRLDGNLNANIPFTSDLVSLIDKNEHEESPPLSIYFSMYMLNKNPNDNEFYFRFKDQLNKYIHYFPSHESLPIYTAGINHCIRKLNTGDSSFLEELFLLYGGYVKSLVEVSNQLSQWTFNNAITVALRLKKFEWIKTFISDYGKFIHEKHRDNAITYNTANYYLYLKDYHKVIELLRNIEYEDIYYNLNSKTILIKTYYETDEYEPLYFLLESFRAYLNRNKKIPESKKVLTKKAIKLIKKLVNLPPDRGEALQKLKKEVLETEQLFLRSWLLEKIEELE